MAEWNADPLSGLQALATNGTLLNQNISQLIQAIQNVFPNFVPVPTSATAPGTPNQVACDTSYLYVCVATNTWRRTALSTF